jgi:hypothetical protein
MEYHKIGEPQTEAGERCNEFWLRGATDPQYCPLQRGHDGPHRETEPACPRRGSGRMGILASAGYLLVAVLLLTCDRIWPEIFRHSLRSDIASLVLVILAALRLGYEIGIRK